MRDGFGSMRSCGAGRGAVRQMSVLATIYRHMMATVESVALYLHAAAVPSRPIAMKQLKFMRFMVMYDVCFAR